MGSGAHRVIPSLCSVAPPCLSRGRCYIAPGDLLPGRSLTLAFFLGMAIWHPRPVSSLRSGREHLKGNPPCHPPEAPGGHWHDSCLGATRCSLPPGAVRQEASFQLVEKSPDVCSCHSFSVCEMDPALLASLLLFILFIHFNLIYFLFSFLKLLLSFPLLLY